MEFKDGWGFVRDEFNLVSYLNPNQSRSNLFVEIEYNFLTLINYF